MILKYIIGMRYILLRNSPWAQAHFQSVWVKTNVSKNSKLQGHISVADRGPLEGHANGTPMGANGDNQWAQPWANIWKPKPL